MELCFCVTTPDSRDTGGGHQDHQVCGGNFVGRGGGRANGNKLRDQVSERRFPADSVPSYSESCLAAAEYKLSQGFAEENFLVAPQ